MKTWRITSLLCLLSLFPITALAQDNSSQSLGDVARRLRKDSTDEVRMTDEDTKKLFASVDTLFEFASTDTGMPRHSAVKRRMVGKADVEKFTRERLAREEFTQRFVQNELSMKKFGFLPRDFSLKDFMVKATTQQIAGWYDEETKTISLLNWVPADKQGPVLAHELTHALQDQNYDLHKWMTAARASAAKPAAGAGEKSNTAGNDDSAIARKAVVEGQAMVVYVDYLLAPFHRSLINTPDLVYSLEDPAIRAVQDSQMMHDAPFIMREAGTFAYQQGLIFEGELLHKGGIKMAFPGVFARPPKNSHEVLQPEAYIANEKAPIVDVPDLASLIGDTYDIYDSGQVGQLDVRAYMKQLGDRRNAEDVASAWQGGEYVTYRRKPKTVSDAPPTTADLALLYVSRWKSAPMADRFAKFYASAVTVRYTSARQEAAAACSGDKCPVWSAAFSTEEGPVTVERWADNRVIVSESFDQSIAGKVRDAAHNADSLHAENSNQQNRNRDLDRGEIGLRLCDIPAFRNFAAAIGDQIASEISHRVAP